MLDSQTIQIIKSTVSALEKHGTDITKWFYQLMFTAHPELLNIFNHAKSSKEDNRRRLRMPSMRLRSISTSW